MASYQYELVNPPDNERGRELWLQHAVGFILWEDMRQYAIEEIVPKLSPEVREQVMKGINDAVYGLMMMVDGVSGHLSNEAGVVRLKFLAQHINEESSSVIQEIDLAPDSDGFCMGYHGWLKGDFGEHPVATKKPPLRDLREEAEQDESDT